MSLLHKALKKAEKEGRSPGELGVFVDTEESPRSSSRVILLVVVAVACLLFVVAVRFLRKPSAPTPKEFAAAPTGGGIPAVPDLLAEAEGKMRAGQWEEARGRLEKAVIFAPQNVEAYNNLGLVLKKLGRLEEADEQYRKALSLDPNCAECLNNLGVLSLLNRDLGGAETHFKKALEARPDYADPYFHLALLLEAQGDLAGARKNYQKFVEEAKGVSADFLLKVQRRIVSLPSS